ncbi:helix-turn-helix domain-containing protein [Azotobacter armeniacus]
MEDFFPLECRKILENIGTRIRRKRLESRMRQADLARNIGVSAPTIGRIEAGDRKVETGTLLLVLWQLGLLDELIGKVPPPPAETTQRRVRLGKPKQDEF